MKPIGASEMARLDRRLVRIGDSWRGLHAGLKIRQLFRYYVLAATQGCGAVGFRRFE